MSQLGDALFSRTRQNVLGLLYAHPDSSFYTNEILRRTGMGVATIKRELDRMVEAGILTLTKVGNQHHYQANLKCPVYEELSSIVRKTFGVADVIRAALVPIQKQIDFAFIYGSLAKGTEISQSDIDVMIVTDTLAYVDVMSLLGEAEESLGRVVNPSIYNLEQIRNRLITKNAFISRVMEQPKLWIKGEDDDIGKVGQSGKDQSA
jgi:predicted nucleotidyltransferase